MVHVVITDPVEFTSELPSAVTSVYGGTVVLNCSVSGRPLPTITWYRNEMELMSSGDIDTAVTSYNQSHIQSSLTIQSLSSNDIAIYNCTGSNMLSNGMLSQVSATVSVDTNGNHNVYIAHTDLGLNLLFYSCCYKLYW